MTEEITIPLCVGKPDDGYDASDDEHKPQAATFSRFVLPFAYKIKAIQDVPEDQELFYKINKQDNLSFVKRRKYFTRETALTMYERAVWLDMSSDWDKTEWGKEDVTIKLRGKNFKLGMLPPRIVLFEANSEKQINDLQTLSSSKAKHLIHTAFLYVDIYFPLQDENPELDDLLMLNEYFRYFGIRDNGHAKYFQEILGETPATYTVNKDTTLLKSQDLLECHFERWANLLKVPIKQGNNYYNLFPESWGKNARKLSNNEKDSDFDENWQIYADNRAYVYTAALLESGGNTLKTNFKPELEIAPEKLQAKDYGHWIKLLNIDPSDFNKSSEKTHKSVTNFERKWADERTYKRWEESGSFYGYSYHSAALLSSSLPFVFTPYSTYYFDTTLLLFYIRMTLSRFGKELTDIFHHDKQNKEWRDDLQELRKQFSKFTILYQFPMASNQQQSIEMFELNRKYFDIDDFFKEIQQEIDNTHDFLESVEANKLGTAANKLARWGIPLAAGGLVAGIFGMNNFNLSKIFDDAYQLHIDYMIETTLVTSSMVAAMVIPALAYWWKNKGEK